MCSFKWFTLFSQKHWTHRLFPNILYCTSDNTTLYSVHRLKVLQEGVNQAASTFHTRQHVVSTCVRGSSLYVCVRFCTIRVRVWAGEADGAAFGHKRQPVHLSWWTVRKKVCVWMMGCQSRGWCVCLSLTRFSWLRAFTRFSSPLMYFTSSTPFILYSSEEKKRFGETEKHD